MRGPINTPTLQSRVTCHLPKKNTYFDIFLLHNFLLNISKHSFTNISEQKYTKTSSLSVLFLSWYTHRCIAGNYLALLHGLRRLQPTMAYKK